jgi:hypothetical protein
MKYKINGESILKESIQDVIKIIFVIWLGAELDIILGMDQHCVIFVEVLTLPSKIIFIIANLVNMTFVNNVL